MLLRTIGGSCEMADYIFNGEQYITFHANTTRASLNITICDDRKIENNEFFVLFIDKFYLNEKYNSCIDTKDYISIITIVDDDNCK